LGSKPAVTSAGALGPLNPNQQTKIETNVAPEKCHSAEAAIRHRSFDRGVINAAQSRVSPVMLGKV
jgi:hypothetical protein